MSSHNEYRNFFMKAMEKFNINSPADLKSDEQKKKFFNYVDRNWSGKTEEAEIYVDEITEANAFLKARAVAIWENKEQFEFNGKIYPVIRVYEETVEEGILKTGARLAKNFGRAAFAPAAIGVDSMRLDKMHDKVKAAMKKQKVEEVEIEEEEEEMEEGALRDTGRALKAVAKGVISPAGAYLNSRKSDAIQRDLDKLKSTRAYRTVQQGRKISRQL